jgi:hypothetical protein
MVVALTIAATRLGEMAPVGITVSRTPPTSKGHDIPALARRIAKPSPSRVRLFVGFPDDRGLIFI